MNNRLGSLVASLFKVLMLVALALFAKRSAFFRPFYWFVVQFGAFFAGLAVIVALLLPLAVFVDVGNMSDLSYIIIIGIWILVSIGSIAEIHKTFEQMELETFGNIIHLSTRQKVLGFIYGLLLHTWLLYKTKLIELNI